MQVLAGPAVAFREALRALPVAVGVDGTWALTRARERAERLTPNVEVARILAYDEPVPALLGALSGRALP